MYICLYTCTHTRKQNTQTNTKNIKLYVFERACNRYRMGIEGPYTDLFFWNVLLNRLEMADVLWQQVCL